MSLPSAAHRLVPHHAAADAMLATGQHNTHFRRQSGEKDGLVVGVVALAIVEHAAKINAPNELLSLTACRNRYGVQYDY